MFPVLNAHNIPATFFINNAFIDNRDLHYERKKCVIRRLEELQDISAEQEISKIFSPDNPDLRGFDLQNLVKGIKFKSKNKLDIAAEKLAFLLPIIFIRTGSI